MSSNLICRAANLRRKEDGQTAIAVVLLMPVIFIFFALAMDTGLWYFDHRTAQNQADAAVLAAVQYLPAATNEQNYFDAVAAVDTWLIKNGSSHGELDCGDGSPSPEFMDLHPASAPDGRVDAIRVCVRRQSPSIFASFSGISFVWVSAAATARVGPATVAEVMPWGLVPTDPDCNTAGDLCVADMDGDGVIGATEYCGYYPPAPDPADPLCPWGMSEDKLWIFKSGDSITPGNFSPISACGVGDQNYVDCIEGKASSEFYEAGETVIVGVQTGNLGQTTNMALKDRYASEGGNHGAPNHEYDCDVESTPQPITPGFQEGWDRNGKAAAQATYVLGEDYYDVDTGITHVFKPGCEYRLVAVPVLASLPEHGSADVIVLGVATFSIAKWDRSGNPGDALGNASEPCGEASSSGPVDPTVNFKCQMVWGYFMRDARPPQALLSIGESDNPFAPMLIAMVE